MRMNKKTIPEGYEERTLKDIQEDLVKLINCPYPLTKGDMIRLYALFDETLSINKGGKGISRMRILFKAAIKKLESKGYREETQRDKE